MSNLSSGCTIVFPAQNALACSHHLTGLQQLLQEANARVSILIHYAQLCAEKGEEPCPEGLNANLESVQLNLQEMETWLMELCAKTGGGNA